MEQIDSDQLNIFIEEFLSKDLRWYIQGLTEATTKLIPYHGWYWRNVNFTRPIVLGLGPEFVGFIENNKWYYPTWVVTPSQQEAIISALQGLMEYETPEWAKKLFDCIQETLPPEYENFDWENYQQEIDSYLEGR